MESDCFANFRKNIIGLEQTFLTANGDVKKMIYADWTASGRGYLPIEKIIQEKFLPFVANTHTDTNTSGSCMTYAYHKAQSIIKKHVNANQDDILISSHSGMTGVTNKLQRILGLRIHEKHQKQIQIAENDRPIIFITHMEHHSNHTSWLESIGDVEIIAPNNAGLPDLVHFKSLLEKYNIENNKNCSRNIML
jgi:selenocysteine lyase/cysteine desulfurase